jgi:hypothetical protein
LRRLFSVRDWYDEVRLNVVSICFNYADFWLRQMTLERARDGSLSPTWRDELPLSNASLPPGASIEGFEMAVDKIRQMPYPAWEPGHAPDWQTALGAWYIDSRSLLTQSDTVNAHRLTAAMVTADDVLSHDVGYPGPNGESRLLSHLSTSLGSIDETSDFARHLLEQSYVQTRDLLTASYLAGLAAGGREVDWVQWLKARVAHWSPDEPGTRRAITEFNHPTFREQLERLPKYWIC